MVIKRIMSIILTTILREETRLAFAIITMNIKYLPFSQMDLNDDLLEQFGGLASDSLTRDRWEWVKFL